MRNPKVVLLMFIVSWAFATIHCGSIEPYENIDFYEQPESRFALVRFSTEERIIPHGYPVEEHNIVTEDGYILGVFRIPYSHKLQNRNAYRPIVLLEHGLMSSSDIWILGGPDNALAYVLADAGYDVWLGNARGNTYSRNHTTLSTERPKFWRFSWHEIGTYDIAAMIDYALATNGQQQQALHYVGHSQGTTVFFALMSSRPEYNAKIKTAHMLAPVAFMDHLEDKLVRVTAPYLGHYGTYSLLLCSQEFLPYNDFVLVLFYNTCRPESRFTSFCDGLLYDSTENGRSNSTSSVISAQTHPAGVSTDQLLHYLQEQQSGHFRQFDFGVKKNLKIYGTEAPPDYATELITCEMHLWYSDNDELAAVEDVLRVADTLPNKVMHHMEDPLWDHGDFAANLEVRKYINEPIIKIMEEFEEQGRL